MTRVRLEPHEIERAAKIGVDRSVQNITEARLPRYGAGSSPAWQLSIEGALAEAAVAKYLDVPWDGALGNYEAADVGPLQVRATEHTDGALIVHPDDKDDAIFILARGSQGEYELAGWIWGESAKHKFFWEAPKNNGRPAFFVTANYLLPMSDLPEGLQEWANRETTEENHGQ